MKTSKYILQYLLLACIAAGCKKEEATPAPDIFYQVSIEDRTVTFNNETTGAASYRWDFGDGESSTEKSPVHTYPGKGKYVPVLYAKTQDGREYEGATVIYIAKTSPVKLNDNSLADWDNVTQYESVTGAAEKHFRRVKVDYDAQYIYLYLEVSSKQSNGDIYDIYLDTDNNPGTGYQMEIADAGYDVLLEGTILGDWLDAFNHKGAQNAFSFEPSGATEFYTVGTIEESGGLMKFEMRLVRSKIKNLATSQAFRLGIMATKNDWSATLGRVPEAGKPALQIKFE